LANFAYSEDFMKFRRILAALLSAVMIAAVSGCGETEETSGGGELTRETAGEAEGTTAALATMAEAEGTTPLIPPVVTSNEINLENAPKMKTESDMGVQSYTVMIGELEYDSEPMLGSYNIYEGEPWIFGQPQPENPRHTVDTIPFDSIVLNYSSEYGYLRGIELTGTIDGTELAGRDFIQAFNKKYPDSSISVVNLDTAQNTTTPNFEVNFDNINEMNIIIPRPTDGNQMGIFHGELQLNFTNIDNSSIKNYFHSPIISYENINNCYLHSSIDDYSHTNITTYENVNNSFLSNFLFLSTSIMGATNIEVTYGNGENNIIRIGASNVAYGTLTANIDGMYASKFELISSNSSISLKETAPNFNSTIAFDGKTADLQKSYREFTFQTQDGDNCPVITNFKDEDGTLIIENAEIQTGGVVEKLNTFDFYNTAMSNEVYRLN
jgi:hypothetical protein